MPLHIYLPQDRLRALANQHSLPDRANGAALFADISGFTALTEVLRDAFGPRRGAEELTRHMEAVYSSLINEIERYGGSVIGFAGDAMLCWFDEAAIDKQEMGTEKPSPSVLAVACGFSLQRMMRAYAKIALPNNTTTALTLKVAVASGPARRFVVGDSRIRCMDLLAGATVSRTAIGEHLAQKGEVLIDEAMVTALADLLTIQEWRNDTETGERFAVVAALTRPVETPIIPSLDIGYFSPEELRPWLHTAVYKREQTGPGSFLTEFRPCAVVFVRFTGIDFDSAAAGAQLGAFVEIAQQVADRHGGTMLDVTIGDKGSYTYLSFGVFSAHEDDARRAVQAALELRERAGELAFLQPVEIGITQGTLRVGAYGGQTRKTLGALGDEVNLAARLMMTAAPGEILLSSHVYKVVEPEFVFEPRAPVRMKGKAEPLPVFALTGERRRRAIRLQEPSYALPMVGRQDELRLINYELDLAQNARSQVMGIVAEPGMGKSRLVAEVIRLAHKKGFVGYGGSCQSDGVNTPYLAWKSIWSAFFDVDPSAPLKKQVRSVENALEDYAPSRQQAMPLLNAVLDLAIPENDFTRNLEPQFGKGALTALLEGCLRAASKDEPILIVMEDMHWVDALSHDLLEDLARSLDDCPICFVLAYRPPQITRLQAPRLEALPQFTRIELHELDRAEAEQAIRAKLVQLYPARSAAVPVQLVDKLMGRAQGNPFYLEELLNYLHDRGLDPRDPVNLERIELPDSLHALVLSRIDQLSEREKTTLRVASIVGRLFRAAWLTGYYPALGDLAHVRLDLDVLDRMDITPLQSEPELAYLFKHIVTHEVTYESLPYALRAQLHEQLAAYLERQIASGAMSESALLDMLVYHYTRSENKAKQFAYLKRAGEAALAVSAFSTAAEYLTRLLELTPDSDPARSAIVLRLAEAHSRLGDFPAARAAIAQAQIAARTETDRAAALALLGEMLIKTGDYTEARVVLSEAVPLARSSKDRRVLSHVLWGVGTLDLEQGNLDAARLALNESLALAREGGEVTRELLALNLLGIAAITQSDLVESERLFAQVYDRAVEAGNRKLEMVALNNLGELAFMRENYALTRDLQQQALAMASEIGSQASVAGLLSSLARTDIRLGDLPAARPRLREGLALARRLGLSAEVAAAVLYFGFLAHAEGQTERALALCGLARRLPAWDNEHQRALKTTLAQWALDPSVVEAGMTKGAELNWDETIQELLNG